MPDTTPQPERDLLTFNWARARAMIYHETQWGCRGMATFYPPMCWLPARAAAAIGAALPAEKGTT